MLFFFYTIIIIICLIIPAFSLPSTNLSLINNDVSFRCPKEVISPEYRFDIPANFPTNRNPLQWDQEDLKYFQNSKYLSEFVGKQYPSEWSRPVVFAVIADEKYIHSLETLLETLSFFNITQNDVLAVSTSQASTSRLIEMGIRSFSYGTLSQYSELDTRCIVSLSKFNAIIDLLQASYSVFFVDLDVFFKKFPLPSHVNASTDIYVQADSTKQILFRFNFGCFFVKPNPRTIELFTKMRAEYLRNTRRWDQEIFCHYLLRFNAAYRFFPLQQYSPLHLYSTHTKFTNQEIHSVVASHTTCVEGSLNKLLLGRVIYHGFATPHYYHQCHRVITISVKPSYSRTALVSLIKIAVHASAALRRPRLRLVGWDYLYGKSNVSNFRSLYDPDKLYFRWNVTLVEEDYWQNMKTFYPKAVVTSSYLSLTSQYQTELKEYADSSSEIVDDLILSVDEAALNIVGSERERQSYSLLLCRFYNEVKWDCLRTCSGTHF